MTPERTLLLSLRPRFAHAILSGSKTVELRRRPINAAPGTTVILYASSPERAVVGTARLQEIRTSTPTDAWRHHRWSLGLNHDEFNAYLDGSSVAYLLLLHRARPLDQPLPLHHLREDGPFRPPQSFRYIGASDPTSLNNIAAM